MAKLQQSDDDCCRKQCLLEINRPERTEMAKSYHNIMLEYHDTPREGHAARYKYLRQLISFKKCKYRRADCKMKNKTQEFTAVYSLPTAGGLVVVCRTAFLKVFKIRNSELRIACEKARELDLEDHRGGDTTKLRKEKKATLMDKWLGSAKPDEQKAQVGVETSELNKTEEHGTRNETVPDKNEHSASEKTKTKEQKKKKVGFVNVLDNDVRVSPRKKGRKINIEEIEPLHEIPTETPQKKRRNVFQNEEIAEIKNGVENVSPSRTSKHKKNVDEVEMFPSNKSPPAPLMKKKKKRVEFKNGDRVGFKTDPENSSPKPKHISYEVDSSSLNEVPQEEQRKNKKKKRRAEVQVETVSQSEEPSSENQQSLELQYLNEMSSEPRKKKKRKHEVENEDSEVPELKNEPENNSPGRKPKHKKNADEIELDSLREIPEEPQKKKKKRHNVSEGINEDSEEKVEVVEATSELVAPPGKKKKRRHEVGEVLAEVAEQALHEVANKLPKKKKRKHSDERDVGEEENTSNEYSGKKKKSKHRDNDENPDEVEEIVDMNPTDNEQTRKKKKKHRERVLTLGEVGENEFEIGGAKLVDTATTDTEPTKKKKKKKHREKALDEVSVQHELEEDGSERTVKKKKSKHKERSGNDDQEVQIEAEEPVSEKRENKKKSKHKI